MSIMADGAPAAPDRSGPIRSGAWTDADRTHAAGEPRSGEWLLTRSGRPFDHGAMCFGIVRRSSPIRLDGHAGC